MRKYEAIRIQNWSQDTDQVPHKVNKTVIKLKDYKGESRANNPI